MTYILDASALLRLLLKQSGAERVREIMRNGFSQADRILISAVKWGEVLGRIDRAQGRPAARALTGTMVHYGLEIVAVSGYRAEHAALIKRDWAIGYADAFCVQLAIEDAPSTLVTADFDFSPLQHITSIEFPQ